MSTPEEKSTDAAEAGAEQEGEQHAAAAATAAAAAAEKVESSDEHKAEAPGETSEEDLEIEVEAPDKAEADPDPIAELNEKIAQLEAGKKENYDRLLRSAADLENFRKRSRRDVKDARLDERGKILKDMLPVIDNLDRAVEHAEQSENEATKSIVDGVKLVLRQFLQSLERHNVTPLDAVGKAFDPATHDAVSQAASAEHAPGTVMSVLQKGYMMEERLLRPSLVVVSVAMPEESKADEAKAEESGEDDKVEAASEESAEESAEASAESKTAEAAGETASESEAGEASEDAESKKEDESSGEDKE